MIVLHTVRRWLALTENWIYHRVRHLPEEIQSHVLCGAVENETAFPMPDMVCEADSSLVKQLSERLLAKLGVRPMSGFLGETTRSLRPNIIHSHFGNIGWENAKVAAKCGAKQVVSFYGFDVNRLPREDKRWLRRYRELFQRADLFVCEGPHLGNCLVKLGCPKEKVKVIHLGVPLETVPFKPRVWKFGEPLRVLLAASFREKKGIPLGFEALGLINKETPVRVTLIGDADSTEKSRQEKRKILEAIEHSGLTERTRMLSFQSHEALLGEAYRHHLFVSPSLTANDGDTEGGAPVSIIEMAASGMPVVSTTHCDIPEILRPYTPFLLAPEGKVQELAAILKWFIHHPGEWRPLLEETRRWVETEFDAVRQGRRLADAYQQLLEEK